MTARARVSDAKGVLLQWQNDLEQMRTQIDLDKQLGEGVARPPSIFEGVTKISNTNTIFCTALHFGIVNALHLALQDRGGTLCSGIAWCAQLSSMFGCSWSGLDSNQHATAVICLRLMPVLPCRHQPWSPVPFLCITAGRSCCQFDHPSNEAPGNAGWPSGSVQARSPQGDCRADHEGFEV